MQLNFGGNMDFMNMLERERLESKKISKTQSVTSKVPHDMGKRNVHIGPSDYVPWLDDRKWAYVRLEGRAFGDVPLNLEYKLEVWDSPNSAGVIIDAVRAAKIAMDRGIGGPILSAVVVLHEVAAGAVLRRRGPRLGGGVHPRARSSADPAPPGAGSLRGAGPAASRYGVSRSDTGSPAEKYASQSRCPTHAAATRTTSRARVQTIRCRRARRRASSAGEATVARVNPLATGSPR